MMYKVLSEESRSLSVGIRGKHGITNTRTTEQAMGKHDILNRIDTRAKLIDPPTHTRDRWENSF